MPHKFDYWLKLENYTLCSDGHKHNKTLQLKIDLAFEYTSTWIYIAIALIFNKHFTFPTIFLADRG